MGTSSGLARFDGVRFVVYARFNTPSMTDDNIRALAALADGSLWVATDGGGLLHYRNGRFQSFGPREGLTNEFVIAIAVDRRGDVWAGTNRGLFRRHGEKFERIDEKLHLPNIAFFALGEARDGRIFAGGPSGLFSFFENGELRPYEKGHDLDGVYHIEGASDGSLWLGTQPRAQNHRRSSTEFRAPRRHQDDRGTARGPRGKYVGRHEGDGLYLLSGNRETVFRAPASLPDNSILAILEDRERSIWVGTADGLVRMSAPDVTVLNSRDGLSGDQSPPSIAAVAAPSG